MAHLTLSRRSFLALASAAAANGIVIPALSAPRLPYVSTGENVSYIGLGRHPHPTFTGSSIVKEVHAWDGVGYPVTMSCQSFYRGRTMPDRFYDSDLCNFLKELPPRFWSDPDRCARYPNVHAYVREQRYGENPKAYQLARDAFSRLPA